MHVYFTMCFTHVPVRSFQKFEILSMLQQKKVAKIVRKIIYNNISNFKHQTGQSCQYIGDCNNFQLILINLQKF